MYDSIFDCEKAPSEPLQFPDADIEALISKYGPEGIWELADRLRERAMKDVDDALAQSDLEIRGGHENI